MNPLDVLIIVTMIFLVVRGVWRGFVREIASLAGVILGIWLAIRFHSDATEYLKSRIPSGDYLSLVSFAAIFLSVLVLCNILGWALKIIFRKVSMGWTDRTLGAGLAVVKGVIITYLVIVLLTIFLPAKAPLIASSKLAPLIVASYQSMVRLVSPERYQEWMKMMKEKKEEITGVLAEKIKDHGDKR
jgi:membrane protein required for colicin V production